MSRRAFEGIPQEFRLRPASSCTARQRPVGTPSSSDSGTRSSVCRNAGRQPSSHACRPSFGESPGSPKCRRVSGPPFQRPLPPGSRPDLLARASARRFVKGSVARFRTRTCGRPKPTLERAKGSALSGPGKRAGPARRKSQTHVTSSLSDLPLRRLIPAHCFKMTQRHCCGARLRLRQRFRTAARWYGSCSFSGICHQES